MYSCPYENRSIHTIKCLPEEIHWHMLAIDYTNNVIATRHSQIIRCDQKYLHYIVYKSLLAVIALLWLSSVPIKRLQYNNLENREILIDAGADIDIRMQNRIALMFGYDHQENVVLFNVYSNLVLYPIYKV